MKENIPLISYERDMNHNYMVLGSNDFFGAEKNTGKSFRVRMLLENKIQGLLPVACRQAGGQIRYYYEINSLQPLDRLLEKSELKYESLRAVLSGCIRLFDCLEEYLLDGAQVILKPNLIYVNVESMEPYFVCYPDYTGDVRACFVELIDELLSRIDHTDGQAVMLGYQAYRYTRNPNYVLSEIRRFIEESEEAAQEEVKQKEEQRDFCFEADDARQENMGRSLSEADYWDCAEDAGAQEDGARRTGGSVGNLVGGIVCVIAALGAGAVIVCARVLKLFALSGDNELYVYGAATVALAAAVLFFICHVKSVRQGAEQDALQEISEDDFGDDFSNEFQSPAQPPAPVKPSAPVDTSNGASYDTVCLAQEQVEERILRGRVNGSEVNVPLDCLPMTIGKLGSVSDFIINDKAVSKIHARFEEHGGRVCVCDLNSTNGTVKNGEVIQINTPVALEPGDRLRFGRSCFTYC